MRRVSKPLQKFALGRLLAVAASCSFLLAASALSARGKKAADAPAVSPAVPAAEVLPVRAKDIYDLTQALSAEAMRRRDPGTRGEAEARAYLAQRMFDSKLLPPGGAAAVVPAAATAAMPEASPEPKAEAKPAAKPAAEAAAAESDSSEAASETGEGDGSGAARLITPVSAQAAPYLQAIPTTVVRTRLLPGGVPAFKSTAGTVATRTSAGLSDVLLLPGEAAANIQIREAPVAFVGFGIVAPELGWDDYKGIDVAGKVVVILDGEPQSDAKAFGGRAAVRWPQKFALAAQKGAAGALIVLAGGDANTAGSPLALLRARRGPNLDYVFDRDPSLPDSQPLKVRGFITVEVMRRVFESARVNFDDLAKQADARGFTGGTLKLSMSTQFTVAVSQATAYNIVGVLPGSDPARAGEAVVYTAHWDGQSPLESAAGVATLLAMAKSAASRGPLPRTQIFAALSPQSECFLGARHLLEHLPSPAQKGVAHINIDGANPLSSDESVIQIGRGRSTLDAVLDAAAKEQERKVQDDPQPELGLLYRSESLLFVKAGIPSLFLGWPDLKRYLLEDFRRRERFGATWSFVGAAQDGELMLSVGRRLAEAKAGPAGLPRAKKQDTL